jgi:hypothetical protein
MQKKGYKIDLGSIQDLDKKASKLVDEIVSVKTKWNDANMIAKNSAGKLLGEYNQIRTEIIAVEKQLNDIGLVGPKELDAVAFQAENAFKLIKFVQENANASK